MKTKKITSQKSFATRCIHAGQSPDPTTGAVSMPLYANSTFVQEAPGEYRSAGSYGRGHNPTRHAFERCLADLENGTHAFAFSSGMAAINAALDLIPGGAHIIACDDLYGGTYRLFERIKKDTSKLDVSYIDFNEKNALENALRKNTALIWIESPTNPLMKIIDLKKVAAFAKKNKILCAIDNTFASPAVQRPLDHGFDIVMHSATKYIGGHSDIIAGALVVNNAALAERLKFIQNSTGGVLGPFESFLALRGLKTLALRMERHNANALKIARYLEKHKKIAAVYYPGLASHPGHALAKKQMQGFGGMLSAVLKTDLKGTKKMLSNCRVFTLAESLGGVESLINHPALMTHASMPKDVREEIGITDSLIRLSVGIEDADDLIADLEQALAKT
jgi:cystathionine gamma-lyase